MSQMELGLNGKVAWVTAASKGLGYASALALAREGCNLAICSRDSAAIEAAAEMIRRDTGRSVLALQADITKGDDLDRFTQAALAHYGGVDVLLSNTGGPPAGQFMECGDAAWQGAFDSLLLPAVRLSRAAIPAMKERGYGRIMYVTSGAVKQPIPGLILSNSLRLAVTGLMKSLAAEVGQDGITVNCVAPGRIQTDRVTTLDRLTAEQSGQTQAAVQANWQRQIPVGRYGTPEEFGSVVAFLASQAASFITGSTLQVDGGLINTY